MPFIKLSFINVKFQNGNYVHYLILKNIETMGPFLVYIVQHF